MVPPRESVKLMVHGLEKSPSVRVRVWRGGGGHEGQCKLINLHDLI